MVGEHAVVIGASMGGLLAARVLADHYQRVTIVERDAFPERDDVRKGVPQGCHAHGLLARGREVLEALFPRLSEELKAQGALDGDLTLDCLWCVGGGYLCQAPSGLMGLLVSRPTLEGYVRRRLLQLSNVRAIEGCAVLRLAASSRSQRIDGVQVSQPLSGGEDILSADLVVDATGRGSRSPAWLHDAGFPRPEEEQIVVGICYTTRWYRRRPEILGGKRAFIVPASKPGWRCGVALAQEGDRWIVSLGGYLGDRAAADERSLVEYARSLPVGELHEIIRNAEPLSEIFQLKFPSNLRRHYERVASFPEGYLVFGDALCSFNPIYGQGMTVAALQAMALQNCLERGADRLAQRFFSAAASVIDAPWQMALGNDLRNPRVKGRRTAAAHFVNGYLDKLHVAARRDPLLATSFIEVTNLMKPASSLMHPLLALRVLRGSLRGEATEAAGVFRTSPH